MLGVGHVRHRRPVRRPPRALRRSRSRRSRCSSRCCSLPALLRGGLPSRSRRVRRWPRGRAPRWRRCAPACACSASRGSARWPPRQLLGVGAAVAVVLRAARGARPRRPGRPRRGGGGAVRGQRHRGAAGHAVEPRRVPGRVRRRAARRLRRRRRPTRSAYGIILQAVEIATAVDHGAPALVKEGLSWRDVRLRALHASPVRLDPLPAVPRRARPRPRLEPGRAAAAWVYLLPRRRLAVHGLDRRPRRPPAPARRRQGERVHAQPPARRAGPCAADGES